MQKTLKYIVYGCMALVPFLAFYVADGGTFDLLNQGTSGMFFPFISGKNLVFRFLVEIAFAGWVLLALLDPKYRPKKSPILIAYAVFMVAILISDMFGANPWRSFWSNFERMEGFVGHIHLFAYFVVLSSLLSTVAEWKTMLKVFLASNVLVMMYGFFQLFGAKDYFFAHLFPKASLWFGSNFPIHQSDTRLDATIGNSAYYAIYCLFFAFIAALFWTEAKTKGQRYLYGALAVLNLISLFYSGTRGTMIGLIGALAVSLGIIAIREKGRIRKMVGISMAVIALVLVGIFSLKHTSFIQNSPTLSRFASISPTDITSMSRLTIWKISFDAWKQHPIFGYGQENFPEIFAERFIPEKMWNLEPWYDRSHDVFFDWLVAGGLVGLLAYLSLFASALYLMWRKETEKNHEFPLRERALLTGLLVGYFIHNIFVFDNLTSYILFIAILAYIVARTYDGKIFGGTKRANEEMIMWAWAPIVGIVLLVVLYQVTYKGIMTNKYLIRGMDTQRELNQGMTFTQILQFQKESFRAAIDMHVEGSEEAREQFLQTTAKMAQVQIPAEVPAADKQQINQSMNDLILSARQEVENSYPKYQHDVRALSVFGMFYNALGDSVSAEKALSDALAISPYKQLTAFDLIRSYLVQKKYAQADALSKKIFLAAPDFPTAMKLYVVCAIYDGKIAEARATIAQVGKQFPIDADVVNALVDTKQYDLAIQALLTLKKDHPEAAAQVDAYINQVLAKKAGR